MAGIVEYLTTYFKAVNARHHDIQQNQIGTRLPQHAKRLFAAERGLDLKPLETQRFADQVTDQLIVVNHQDPARHALLLPDLPHVGFHYSMCSPSIKIAKLTVITPAYPISPP